MYISRPVQYLMLLPVVQALLGTLLCLLQGGIGGGHGAFDTLIVLLGLPSTLLFASIEHVPLPKVLENQLVLFVWLPALLNMTLLFLVGVGVSKLKTQGR